MNLVCCQHHWVFFTIFFPYSSDICRELKSCIGGISVRARWILFSLYTLTLLSCAPQSILIDEPTTVPTERPTPNIDATVKARMQATIEALPTNTPTPVPTPESTPTPTLDPTPNPTSDPRRL